MPSNALVVYGMIGSHKSSMNSVTLYVAWQIFLDCADIYRFLQVKNLVVELENKQNIHRKTKDL